MGNHEKVYGICENKCMVEVLPKEAALPRDGGVIISGYWIDFTSQPVSIAAHKSYEYVSDRIDNLKDGYKPIGIVGTYLGGGEGLVIEQASYEYLSEKKIHIKVHNTNTSAKTLTGIGADVLYRKL